MAIREDDPRRAEVDAIVARLEVDQKRLMALTRELSREAGVPGEVVDEGIIVAGIEAQMVEAVRLLGELPPVTGRAWVRREKLAEMLRQASEHAAIMRAFLVPS